MAPPLTTGFLQLPDPFNSPERGEMGRDGERGEATLLTKRFIWCVIIVSVA
jgi:hypothetical protein